jgi:glycosyltransferase involved in cell wall biosynthesis
MKILVISHFIPYPPHGGSPQRNYNLFKEAAKGNSLYFLTFNQRPLLSGEENIKEAADKMREFCDDVRVVDIPTDSSRLRWFLLLFLNLFSFQPYSAWRFWSPVMRNELKAALTRHKFDLVHIDTIALAGYVKYTGNIPSVLNHHNIESTLMLRRASNEKNPLVRLYLYLQGRKLRRHEKKWAPKYSVNITVSGLDGIELKSMCPDVNIEVIPNGTDIDYFKPSSDSCGHGLIYTGGMTWYPNRDAMIYFCREIFPLIKKQIPDVRLDLIGRNPPREITDAAWRDNSIKTHGYIDDIRPYMAAAAVYIVPIRVGGGTRLKILDAMASGKAIVSTSVGCEGIEVTPEESILIGDTPEAFSAQTIRLLQDVKLRRTIEMNARRLAEEKYSWIKIGQKQREMHGRLRG